MNTGIELLVKRIKDCPDEFVGGEWNRLMDLYSNFKGCFTEEEKTAVDAVLLDAKREVFTGKVMELIANGEVLGEFAEQYAIPTRPTKMYTGAFGAAPIKAEGASVNYSNAIANSLSIGREQLTEQNLIDIKAQLANLK